MAGKDLAANIDVDRAADFSRLFGFNVSGGPYVVVTRSRPDGKTPLGEHLAIDLAGLGQEATTRLLTEIAGQIVSGKLDQARADSKGWWLKLADFTSNALASLGALAKHIKVTLKGDLIETTIEGK